jgi:hypothetical protein
MDELSMHPTVKPVALMNMTTGEVRVIKPPLTLPQTKTMPPEGACGDGVDATPEDESSEPSP